MELDPEVFGREVGAVIREALKPIKRSVAKLIIENSEGPSHKTIGELMTILERRIEALEKTLNR